ncbi:efflux RND transporter periplasmic adaptor subunit [Aquisphaera giovannonii]|uniref:efflux RND transporter periplasmic adaptor subunit n=1 Tax=Aquisphaera giovannonii TaxID=406548 RepID=UPI0011E0028C|nr:efflux RND transporter periplasmic adaptor subunit [Aquisphaera giovannonii]
MNGVASSSTPRRVKWAGPVAACVVLAALGGCRNQGAPPAPAAPTVGVVPSRRMDVPIESITNGTTRAIEEVVIRARVRGFLTERHFKEGTTVKAGDLLFVIDEEPYKVALKSAQARKDEAEASLTKAEKSKGREVAAAKVQLDKAQLHLAVVEEGRMRALMARQAGSREDFDRAEAERKKYEAQVAADEASYQQAEADYEVGILAAKAQVEASLAAVRDAELNLGYCRMVAPITGRIGEARVKIGNLVGPEATGGGAFSELATIQQLDPMAVDVRVAGRDLERATGWVKRGLKATLIRPGLGVNQEGGEQGEWYFIDNTIDQTTSTFLAKIKFPNAAGSILPGEYVRLRSVVEHSQGAVVVPEQCVIETGAGPVVYVVDQDGKVESRRVEAGETYEGVRIVSKGLDEGVQVIVEGLQLVRPGIPVKVEPANLAKPVGEKLTATDAASGREG